MSAKSPPLSGVYFRFLQLSRSLAANSETALSANERVLLEYIVLAWHEQSPMAVRDAIVLGELGSPATLHKRVIQLRTLGFLEVLPDPSDRRTKLLVPTEKALHYFEQLGRAMALQSMNEDMTAIYRDRASR